MLGLEKLQLPVIERKPDHQSARLVLFVLKHSVVCDGKLLHNHNRNVGMKNDIVAHASDHKFFKGA